MTIRMSNVQSSVQVPQDCQAANLDFILKCHDRRDVDILKFRAAWSVFSYRCTHLREPHTQTIILKWKKVTNVT